MSVAHGPNILYSTSPANMRADLTKRKPEFISETVPTSLFL